MVSTGGPVLSPHHGTCVREGAGVKLGKSCDDELTTALVDWVVSFFHNNLPIVFDKKL